VILATQKYQQQREAVDNVAYNKKTILYVGGLDEQVDEKVLLGAFSPFGEIVTILIPRDAVTGKHRGFGFVEFEETEDAAQALENMMDSELYGRVVKISIAKPNAIRAQAVWSEADKWYGNLAKDSQDLDQTIQHQQNIQDKMTGQEKQLESAAS